jgi:hypothetical protein
LLKTHKNKKKNKFIITETQYIGITATINGFRSTLASCEGRLVCPSDGLANHVRGLKHGNVDAIECFDVVAVSRATH